MKRSPIDALQQALEQSLPREETAEQPPREVLAATSGLERDAAREGDASMLADQLAIARSLRSFRPEASPALRRQGLQAILGLGRDASPSRAREARRRMAAPLWRPGLRLATASLAVALALVPIVSRAAPGQALYPLRQASAQLLHWMDSTLRQPLARWIGTVSPAPSPVQPAEEAVEVGRRGRGAGDTVPNDDPAVAPGVSQAGAPDPARRADRRVALGEAPEPAPAAALRFRGTAGTTTRATRAIAGAAAASPTPTLVQGATVAATAAAPEARRPVPTSRPSASPEASALAVGGSATTASPTGAPSSATPAPASPTPTPSPPQPASPSPSVTLSPSLTPPGAAPSATATQDPSACDVQVAGRVQRADAGAVAGTALLVFRVDAPEGEPSIALADDSGTYEISGLCAGDHLVAALLLDPPDGAWEGFYDADGDGEPDVLALGPGSRRTGIDITLAPAPGAGAEPPVCPGPTSSLRAQLRDEDGQLLEGATLQLYGPLGSVYEAQSDPSGEVGLDSLCPGYYQAAATFDDGAILRFGLYDPNGDDLPDWLDLSDPQQPAPTIGIRLVP